jgi:hypothetical protein
MLPVSISSYERDVLLEVSFGPMSTIQEYEHQILLAPNPTKDHLTVEAEGFSRLEVLNYLGQSLFYNHRTIQNCC